jgi:hypothetical protein
LLVTGAATRLQPSFGRYVSLVYDLGSVPGGPTVCEPTVELEGMFVGIWAVDASSKSGSTYSAGSDQGIGITFAHAISGFSAAEEGFAWTL